MRYPSQIVASLIVSESEIIVGYPEYNASWEYDNPEFFRNILFNLGLDITLNYVRQDGLTHRNRFNKIVLCSRWVGESRIDTEWIESGYASTEAKDKYSGSRILEDLYRAKSATVDIQDYLEDRDKYAVIDTSVWID